MTDGSQGSCFLHVGAEKEGSGSCIDANERLSWSWAGWLLAMVGVIGVDGAGETVVFFRGRVDGEGGLEVE